MYCLQLFLHKYERTNFESSCVQTSVMPSMRGKSIVWTQVRMKQLCAAAPWASVSRIEARNSLACLLAVPVSGSSRHFYGLLPVAASSTCGGCHPCPCREVVLFLWNGATHLACERRKAGCMLYFISFPFWCLCVCTLSDRSFNICWDWVAKSMDMEAKCQTRPGIELLYGSCQINKVPVILMLSLPVVKFPRIWLNCRHGHRLCRKLWYRFSLLTPTTRLPDMCKWSSHYSNRNPVVVDVQSKRVEPCGQTCSGCSVL